VIDENLKAWWECPVCGGEAEGINEDPADYGYHWDDEYPESDELREY